MKQESVNGELDWFFSERMGMAGELSPPSIHAAQEAQSLSGAGTGSNAVQAASAAHDRAIRMLPPATRSRAIGDILHRLSHCEQLLLKHAHRDGIDARAQREAYAEHLGPVAPVVVALMGAAAVAEFVAGARKDTARRARLVALRLEVERDVAKAHFAFWRLAGDRPGDLEVRRRRRLTEDLAARLGLTMAAAAVDGIRAWRDVEKPRLLTTADLREMGAIQ